MCSASSNTYYVYLDRVVSSRLPAAALTADAMMRRYHTRDFPPLREAAPCRRCAVRHCGGLQVADDWWGNSTVCQVPGTTGQYPASVPWYSVCGGLAAVRTVPLLLGTTELGSLVAFRDYGGRLTVTVTLDATASLQPVYLGQPGT